MSAPSQWHLFSDDPRLTSVPLLQDPVQLQSHSQWDFSQNQFIRTGIYAIVNSALVHCLVWGVCEQCLIQRCTNGAISQVTAPLVTSNYNQFPMDEIKSCHVCPFSPVKLFHAGRHFCFKSIPWCTLTANVQSEQNWKLDKGCESWRSPCIRSGLYFRWYSLHLCLVVMFLFNSVYFVICHIISYENVSCCYLQWNIQTHRTKTLPLMDTYSQGWSIFTRTNTTSYDSDLVIWQIWLKCCKLVSTEMLEVCNK